MKSKTYLAVDLGASSGRVMAGVYDGERVVLHEIHRFANGVKEEGGTYRWDVEALFREIKEGLRKAGREGKAITSIGVDTWGVDYALLDGEGRLVDQPFAYRDARTNGMQEETFKRMPRRDVYEVTGIQFMFFNSLFQILSEVVAGRPELDKAERLLFMPDLLNYWLSGRAVNEYSIASTSQLLDARSRGWATGMMERLGIPQKLFGEIVMPGTVLGSLREELTRELNVEPFNVVAVGAHDTASAVAAVPVTDKRPYAYLSSGTWSLMGVEVPEPVINDQTYDIPLTNEGGVCRTIRLLRNIGGLWLVQECQRHWAEEGEKISFDELVRLASEAESFIAVIDPDADEFAAPGDMPEKIRAFAARTGQRVPESKGEIIRTALESLALRYRWVLERLEQVTGKRLETLHIVGGGTQNRLLNQFAANAVNRTVKAGPVEATALGNIVVQMMAAGDLSSLEEGRALVGRSFATNTYEPEKADLWKQAYDRFLGVAST